MNSTWESALDLLYKKLYGCEAAGRIANSMGDVTESMGFDQIREKFGFVEQLRSQDKVGKTRLTDYEHEPWQGFHAHHRPAGIGEDGQERHKLTMLAILRKNGRITALDLARTWIDAIDETKFGYLIGTQDFPLLKMLKAGMMPWEVGRHAHWPGMIGTAKMIVPVGMVNACNADQAARDAWEIAQIKDSRGISGNYAVDVAAAMAAAVAEAFRDGTSVQTIVDTALRYIPRKPLADINAALDKTGTVTSWEVLAQYYQQRYVNRPMSDAVEVMSRALAVFKLADGNVRNSILWPVNMGRDCDCAAFFAASMAGALKGIEEVPEQWLSVIESQATADPYTVLPKTARECAEGMHRAVLSTRDTLAQTVSSIDALRR